jgi:hypothetical protein
MKTILVGLTLMATGLLAGNAQADNSLYISNDLANNVVINIAGDRNGANVEQMIDGLGGGNQLQLSITGNLNGAAMGSALQGPLMSTGLAPGQLTQSGHDNFSSININGSQNLFAVSQFGSHNLLTAMIFGNNNQAAVVQAGAGNSLSFVQNGDGNRLSVIQRSY